MHECMHVALARMLTRLEDGLPNLGLVARGRAAKHVEADVKPLVDGGVDGMVLVANLLARQPLFQRLAVRVVRVFRAVSRHCTLHLRTACMSRGWFVMWCIWVRGVDGVVLVADLLARQPLRQRLRGV